MKKLLLIFTLCLSMAGVFAQSAAELKNAGNAALKAKDYKTALENYEKFMQAPDTSEDPALVFNSGYCASKIDDYEKAIKYFDLSIKGNYKTSNAYYFKAVTLKKMDKVDEMIATLKKGIEACPKKKSKMVSMLAKHYLQEGQLLYNEGAKILQDAAPMANTDQDKYKAESAKAKECFKQALENLNKASELAPAQEDIKTTIASVKEALK